MYIYKIAENYSNVFGKQNFRQLEINYHSIIDIPI